MKGSRTQIEDAEVATPGQPRPIHLRMYNPYMVQVEQSSHAGGAGGSKRSSESETSTSRSCCPPSRLASTPRSPSSAGGETPAGWVATNQEMTHRVLGVRADRVVAHGDAPPGFLVHGGPMVLWTAYLNGGDVPHGDTFRSVVRELAGRAGVDPSPIERAQPRDRRSELLHDFFRLCRGELHGQSGRSRSRVPREPRLPRRGDRPGRPRRRSSGAVHEERARSGRLLRARDRAVRRARGRPLARAGSAEPGETSRDESERSGRGRFKTPIPRRVTSTFAAQAAQRCRRTGCPRSFVSPSDDRRELVLVEGLIDVHHLRAHGYPNIAAVGGARVSASALTRLGRHGIESVVLAFDNDAAGRDGAARAVDRCQPRRPRAGASRRRVRGGSGMPRIPTRFVREHGLARFRDLVDEAVCAVTWHALELTGNTSPDDPVEQRREALASCRPVARHAAGTALARAGGRDWPRRRSVRLLASCCRTHIPRPLLG